MLHKLAAALVFVFLFMTAGAARGAEPASIALQVDRVQPSLIRLGGEVRVVVRGLNDKIAKERFDVQKLVLWIDGRAFPGLPLRIVAPDVVAFDLKRTDDTRAAWAAILGRPTSPVRRGVPIRLAVDGTLLDVPVPARAAVTLQVYNAVALRWCIFGVLVLLALFIWLAITSNIIRDSAPPKPAAGNKKPYSLARFQMAVWFFLVIAAFLFLYVITLTYDTITPQALTLIGIGTGTALGSAVIDGNKRSTSDNALATLMPQRARMAAELAGLKTVAANLAAVAAGNAATQADVTAAATAAANRDEKAAQLAAIEEQIDAAAAGLTQPVSTSFLMDILTDANGISFHRFQMFVWTLVLGVIFCVSVWEALAMPLFNETLLALLGISAGTYLGFKMPERQQ